MDHIDNQFGKIRGGLGHTYPGSNQQLSNGIQNPLNKRENTCDTVKLMDCSVLVKSWLLGDNL